MIVSRPITDEYVKGWDRIFGKTPRPEAADPGPDSPPPGRAEPQDAPTKETP